jgi:two-component system phosphate regulon sensor histidine kinase PhoR
LAEVISGWPALAERIPIAERGGTSGSVTLPVEVDGRDLWLSFVAVRAADGIVYTFRDLTAERRLEEEKSDFVATISHELRTPMAAVYGAAQTLLRRDINLTSIQGRQLVEMIATQASRLSQITEEVLLTNQLDRGELYVTREPLDVGDLVQRTVDALASRVSDSTVFDVDIDSEIGAAAGDADRVQQVLVNLLDNAIKYGSGTPVQVRVESANAHVRISVADSGPGISLADQQRIFEKFFRADPGHAQSPSGSGLGLYISRELAQRMGGRLEVRSEPGAGTTFVFELPSA